MQHADTPHALALLRPRRERPRRRRAAEQRDELAALHSITSSARASSVGGTVEAEHPGGLQVDDQLELGRLHDRQVRRLGALEDAAGVDAGLTIGIRDIGSVAHQPADLGIGARCICRGDPMMRRQVDQLDAPAVEEGVAGDEEGVGPLARKRCEGSIDLAAGAGVEDVDLQPHGASGRFHVSQRGFGIVAASAGLTSTATPVAPGTSSRSSLQPLCRQLAIEKIDAGQVAARPGEARDKTKLDRVFADDENDGDRRGCRLGRQRRLIPPSATITATSPAHQFGRQRRQPIGLTLRPAVFDRDVLAFDIAGSFRPWRNAAQTLRLPRQATRRRETRSPASPAAARAPRAASSRRAAEQRDELAPSCMTRKEHCEGRRGAGHDRTRVATGSPQPFRIPNRE